MEWINPFNKVADLVSEVVEDTDARNKLNAELETLKQQVYIAELNSKTIPWADACHKLGRQFLAAFNVLMPCVVLLVNPEIDINKLMVVSGAGVGLSGLYTAMKGRGK